MIQTCIYLASDLYYAHPAQHHPHTTAGEELQHLDHDLSQVCKVSRLAWITVRLLELALVLPNHQEEPSTDIFHET